MGTTILHWTERVAKLMSIGSAVFGVAITSFITLATLMRYFFNAPLSITEEIVGLLFTAMVFLALPSITIRGQHVTVTIVTDLFPAGLRHFMLRAAAAGTLFFCIWFGWLCWDYLQITYRLNALSPGSRLMLWPWTALLPLCCGIAAIAAALRVIYPVETVNPEVPEVMN